MSYLLQSCISIDAPTFAVIGRAHERSRKNSTSKEAPAPGRAVQARSLVDMPMMPFGTDDFAGFGATGGLAAPPTLVAERGPPSPQETLDTSTGLTAPAGTGMETPAWQGQY